MLTKNLTPFAFGTKITSRHPPRPEMTIVLRGTYAIGADGTLSVVDDSVERGSVTGDLFYDDDRENECIHASDFADFKLSAEVLVTGNCFAPGDRPVTDCPVEIAVGNWSKALHVFGDRRWSATGISKPEPFETMALSFRNAFGGPGHALNPVGKGFKMKALPNLEHPKKLIATPLDQPVAACLGPVHPDWPQRRDKVGVQYGADWLKKRAPFFAADFDWRFFSAAAQDQQLKGYLRGDESVRLINLHPGASKIETTLPGLRTRAFVKDVMGRFREATMSLDTVLVSTAEQRLYLSWRGVDPVTEDDMEDVAFVLYATEQLGEPPETVDHYRDAMDAFEADPIGLVADMPPELLELGQRMAAAEDGEDPYPDAPDQGNPLSTMLARKLGPVAIEMQQSIKENIEKVLADVEDGIDQAEETLEKVETPTDEELEIARAGNADLPKKVESPADKVAEQKGKLNDALKQAAEQSFDAPPTPMIPKPGALPDSRIRHKMRQVLEKAAELREQAANKQITAQARAKLLSAAEQLEEVPHEPSWVQLDPEYTPPLEPIPTDEPGPGRNLSEQDLTGRDLRGYDLSGANLSSTILTRANLAGAKLVGANLHRAILYKTDLTGADLSEADLTQVNGGSAHAPSASFREANIDEAFFEKANLEGADLSGASGSYQAFAKARLKGVKAHGCTITHAEFTEANLRDADFEGADLTRSRFYSCRAEGARFTDAKLQHAGFREADAEGANFVGVAAERTVWLDAKLDGADFSYGTFVDAHFTKASAVGATFNCANLRECRLYRVILNRATLEEANLFRADLCKARLTETSFRKSNLYDAKFLGAQGKGTDFTNAVLTASTLEQE